MGGCSFSPAQQAMTRLKLTVGVRAGGGGGGGWGKGGCSSPKFGVVNPVKFTRDSSVKKYSIAYGR